VLKELSDQGGRCGLGHRDQGRWPPLSWSHPGRLEGLLLGLGQLGGLVSGEVAQGLDDGGGQQVAAVAIVSGSFEAQDLLEKLKQCLRESLYRSLQYKSYEVHNVHDAIRVAFLACYALS